MKLSKKTSIWSYILEIPGVSQLIRIIASIFCFVVIYLTGYLIYLTGYLTRHTYLAVLDERLNCVVIDDSIRYFINGLLIWMIIALIAVLVWSAYKVITQIIPDCVSSIRIYRRACYLPITELELNDNNIHNAQELTVFLTEHLFKDCQCSGYWYSMSFNDNIICSYFTAIHMSNEFKLFHKRNQIEAAVARKMVFHFDLWLTGQMTLDYLVSRYLEEKKAAIAQYEDSKK